MPTVAEYEAWKARQQQANVGKANIVLNQPWPQEPDQFAADLNFAKEASAALGNTVPLPMVQDPGTRSVFERIVAEKKQSTILTQSPKLADWLRVPANTQIARDDLEGLSWWETTTGAGSNAVQRGVTRLPQMYNQWMAEGAAQRAQDADKSFGEIYGQERATVGVEGKLIDTAVGPITDAWTAGSRFLTARLSQAFGGDQQAAAAYYQQQAGEISKQIAAIPMSPAATAVRDKIGALEPTGDVQADLGNFLGVIGSDPAGFAAFLTETAVETAPSLAAAFGVGVATRNPAAVAMTLGTTSGLQERFTAPAEFLQERGIDISTPQGAMAAVTNPDLMREAAERGEIRGIIIGALDTISGGVAGEALARSPILNLALQSMVQAAFGGGGEAAAQVASGQELNVSDVLIEAMAEFVTAPLDVASVAAARFAEGTAKATAAADTVAALEEIAGAAAGSVTRTRSPDTFRDFITSVTANGARENLFVPADAFTEYFQSKGIDPFELADQLAGMDADDLRTAMETGGSVKIPTATWAADMAGTEHDQFVIQNAAFSPDDMTGMQAAEFEAMKTELLAEAWEEAEAVRQEAESLRQVYDRERDQVVGALRAAGRSPDVAAAEALPLVEFRRVMAGRMGLTPEEFAARYPLPGVQGERPEGLNPRNVDELTRTLAEARARRSVGLETRKTPLLEFIAERGGVDDPGGELAARDAAVVKRRGKKTLNLARDAGAGPDMFGGSADRGMDTTARAAVESGFMADDPDVLAWLEAERSGTEAPDLTAAFLRAVDAELRAEVEAPAADDLGGIEEYLAGLGLSLEDSDADIRAAIEGDGEGRAYGQGQMEFVFSNPVTLTDTDAFRSWFEGSVVMDENGDPLVVHHTTWTDFDTFDRQYAAKKFGRDMEGIDTIGLWFTDNKAANYGPKRMDVYLNIKKPLYFDDIPGGDDAFTQLYKLIEEEGGATAYREMLKAGGFDGIIMTGTKLDGWDQNVMIPFEPTQIKSVTNGGRFDPADPSIYNQADAGFQGGGARGSIQFPGAGVANGQTIISLFQSADLSTFLHETGHYFLTVTQDMARMDPTSTVAADLQTIKDWWHENADAVARDSGPTVTADDVRLALDAGTTGDAAKDSAIDTGMQEQFARAAEQYFLEGKAPSVELRGAFERFSAWLLSIYKTLRGLRVNVTGEMRGVFDRMLATDDQISAAQADIGADVGLTADDLGMTPEQFDGFVRLRDQARDEAKARTLAEAMKPIRRAATKAYQAERAKVRERIETETKQQPVYRAIQELRFGKDFAGNDVEPLKLNRGMIEADYGAGYIPFLPGATKDGAGHRNAVFSTEGGVHPDVAAGAYGFPTGRDMLDALSRAQPLDAVIEAETNKEMEFRHSDPLKDGSIQQEAMDAVHNDVQGRVLAARLEAFNDIAGTDRGLTHKQAREAARRSLRGMTVKDATRSDRFLAAERKAAAEVARLTATVTRTGMWMDAARRRVEVQARGAVREGDGAAALALAPKVGAANHSTQRHNEQAAALVEASRRQLLNHMLYAEARKVEAETDQVMKRVSMLRKANARLSKTRDINFVLAARAVGARFGMTRPDSAFDFNAWLEQLRFDDPVTASAMVNTIDTYTQEAKPYRELTVAEFGAVKDAIESLLSLARTTRSLEIEGQAVDRRAAIDAMVAVAEPRGKTRAGTNAAPTKREKTWLSALTTGAALVRTEAWARDMDDGQVGVFTRYIVKPVMDALGKYRADRSARLDELLAIVEPRRGELLGKAVNAPEIGYTFENKGALLHAVLHSGSESGKRKLLMGRGWSAGMIGQKPALTKSGKPRVDRQGNPIMDKGVLDTSKWDAMIERLIADGTITADDKRMVEKIWGMMDSLKRPAQSAHKRIYGHYFGEVEAAPFTNSLGTWRGGYVPAIIDQYASVDAGKQDAAAALDSQMDASMFPSTGSGFTKGRVEYNQPLALNLQSLPGHVDKVLRFTHLEPTIRQTSSLLSDRGLREAVSKVNRDAIDAILTPWLVRTARQAVEAPSTSASGRQFSKIMRTIRKRVGLHMMAINIVNAAQQVTGIPSAAVLVKVKHLKGATVRFAKDAGAMRSEAIEASAMMRDRMDNSSRVTAQEIDKIIVEPTIAAEVDRFVNQHGYILQQGTQNVVDLIVWHAGYDQAVQQGMSDADAVFEADSIVRRTQGSFNPEDVSAFETGTAFQRVFTMFTSYFNTQLNLLGGEALTTIRTMGWAGKSRLFHLYFFGIMIPAVVAEAISLAARGELGDEDDDGLTDDMLELFIGSQVKFLAGAVPGLGALTVAALNKFNDQPFDDKLSISPANYLLERAAGAPGSIYGAATGSGSPSRALADGITALGLVLGVPTGQLAKSAGYLAGVAEGKSEPANVGDVLRGVTSGRDGTE